MFQILVTKIAKIDHDRRPNRRCCSYSTKQVVQKEPAQDQNRSICRKDLCPNGSTRRSGKYSWENHYRKNKDFSTKEDFLTWLHRKPNNIFTSKTKNGVEWWYFTGCDRKGNHVISNCRKTGAITQA